jgi:flagellar biosynthesis/type III secretory pathway M-ring protein FliF/YscJ
VQRFGPDLGAVQSLGSADDELKRELKKINNKLKKMMDLKKQSNMLAGAFYCCIIALFFFYLQQK